EPGAQGGDQIAAAGGVVFAQGPQQAVGEGTDRVVGEQRQDGAGRHLLVLDEHPAAPPGHGQRLPGLFVGGGGGDRPGGCGQADDGVVLVGGGQGAADVAAGAGRLEGGRVVAAGGHGGAAVGGEHHQPLPLGHHEHGLAGAGGGRLHDLGEHVEGVTASRAGVAGGGRGAGLGDDQTERRVEQAAVEVA